jgi:UDP-glucose 4-epimerase
MEWVYSKDAAAGAVLALKAERLQDRVFNISTGRVYQADEVAASVRRVIPAAKIRLEEVTEAGSAFPEVHDPLDLTRSRSQLGYEPCYNLEDAVRDYVAWYQRLG